MDLDDLDLEPKPAPTRRVSRFAPKSGKLIPKAEPKPEPKEPEPAVVASGTETKPESTRDDDQLMSEEREVKEGEHVQQVQQEQQAVNNHGDNDDDVVVREIDVYFTPSIGDDTKLYVMQYVMRPLWRPYELDERCQEVRVKPKTAEVEVDLSINDSANWDSDFANKVKMGKQTLSTSWIPTPSTSFVVGVLMGDKLHLNPVHAVVQLRPSLEHLKSGGSKRKSNVASDAELAVKLEDSNSEKPVGQTKKQQNKRAESANAQNADFEEHWIALKYRGSKSESSSRYLQKMAEHESSAIDFKMSPHDYLGSLCPAESNSYGKPQVPSRKFLLSLPLEKRVKRLLLEGPPIRRFDAIKHFTADNPIEDVLISLQVCGQLVQGLWVPKTSLLFPNPSQSDYFKIAARDYVLALFNKSLIIDLLEIDVHTKLKENMKPFLKLFADERPSTNYWKFKEKSDASFIQNYPKIVKEQLAAYAEVEKKIIEMSQKAGAKNNPGRKLQTADKPLKLSKTDGSTMRMGDGGGVIKKTISNETREAILKALPKVFQTHKVCSFQLIRQSLKEKALSRSFQPKADPRLAITAASGADDAPPEELQQIVSEIATNIHGVYVLKSSVDHPEYDPLRRVVINLLLARGPNAKIQKSLVLEAAREAIKKETVSNQEYIKVMSEFCVSKGSYWVLKSGDGKPS